MNGQGRGGKHPRQRSGVCKGPGVPTLWHIPGAVTGCAFLFLGEDVHCGEREEWGERKVVGATGAGS